MKKKDKIINEFLQHHIKTQKTQFQKKDTDNIEELISFSILYPISDKVELYELNSESVELNKVVFVYAENLIKSKIPLDLIKGFEVIEEFKEVLKEKNGIKKNIINAYNPLITGLKSYLLYLINKEGFDVNNFYINDLKKKGERENTLFQFEKYFFNFLPNSGSSVEDLWTICKHALNGNDKYYVNRLSSELPRLDIELAKKLYLITKNDTESQYLDFKVRLLHSLHEKGYDEALNILIRLIDTNDDLSFSIVTSLSRINKSQIQDIYSKYVKEEKNQVSKIRALCDIIENELIDEKMREKCFVDVQELLENSTDSIHDVFTIIFNSLKNYEAEKYALLIIYLGKTSNYEILKNFFWRFENPQFMFHLLNNVYKVKWLRNSISLFEESILHFWSVSQEATEKHILKMFDPKLKLGLLPVEVIMCGYGSPLQINLLNLKTKEEQEKAIECFCLFPHSFERLLPMLLELRKSKFPSVKIKLERNLGLLILESYHEMLYDAISNLMTKSKRDILFLKEIEKPLEIYKKIKNLKSSINDLNPLMNEKDLVNYYYELEREKHSQMMNQIGKNSFFGEAAKNTIIVRGNSWKFPNKDVMPLGNVKSEQWIDGRAYRNPDLFELTLNKFDKE